jgi:S1-C subfamily serine protease
LSIFEKQLTDAIDKLGESVVNISSTRYTRNYFFGKTPFKGAGSGVILDQGGIIITNNHVIDDVDKVHVRLKNGQTYIGEVIGADEPTDTALIRVNEKNLPAADLGDSDHLKVGQIAITIGNSLGLPGGPTVSTGVISALGRPLPGTDFILDGLIQTDAAINPGNSGGPLANIQGSVIGINTAMIPFANGMGFAIPINSVKRIAKQIIEKGRVIRPWLGISGITLNEEISRMYGLHAEKGVLLIEISDGGPAYEAGLNSGDIIVKIDSFNISSMTDLLTSLTELSIGDEVTIHLIRKGRKYETSLQLLESPIRQR